MSLSAQLSYPEAVGYLDYLARLGGHVPSGETVVVGQVEPREQNATAGYLPNFTLPEFAGLDYEVVDGASAVSGHATDVGGVLYGDHYSLTYGVRSVRLFMAGYNEGFLFSSQGLNPTDPSGPRDLGVQVLSNSWTMNLGSVALTTQLVRRLDWLADAYDTVIVDGVANEVGPIPQICGTLYNGITVGLLDKPSSSGPVDFTESDIDTTGRSKPDLVAPMDVTSAATPLVSSIATLLLDEVNLRVAAGQSGFGSAHKPALIKSLMLSGAVKPSGWAKGDPASSTDDTQFPLDRKWGAGVVNIDFSQRILSAGTQAPGWVAPLGWDYAEGVTPSTMRLYHFLKLDEAAEQFTATLTWNRKIASTGNSNTIDQATLPHFRLLLFSFDGISLTLEQDSNSPKDNLQHLQLASLASGRAYLICVLNTGAEASDYALTWLCRPAAP